VPAGFKKALAGHLHVKVDPAIWSGQREEHVQAKISDIRAALENDSRETGTKWSVHVTLHSADPAKVGITPPWSTVCFWVESENTGNVRFSCGS